MATKPRTFVLRSPHMHGSDITDFQHLLNARFKSWEVNHTVKADGIYGQSTRAAAKTVACGLGIAQGPINAHGITPHLRTLIRHPEKRNRTERQRADDRVDWRRRLRKRYAAPSAGPQMAVAYARSHVGVRESPAGSNRGPRIDQWSRLAGIEPGPYAYWCGAFVNACLVAAGLPAESFMAYCPALEAHARAGLGGWHWHGPTATPAEGWVALFTEAGVAGHQELVVADGKPLRTIGGNTSKGDGSASNGGEVAAHNFGSYHGLPLRGYAEPPYHR